VPGPTVALSQRHRAWLQGRARAARQLQHPAFAMGHSFSNRVRRFGRTKARSDDGLQSGNSRRSPNRGLWRDQPFKLFRYNALWLSANRKTAKGLTFDTSFTYSKSIDITSTSGDAQIRNAYDLNSEKGLSDFDARFRFVASVLYQLPWTVKRPLKFFQDWSLGIIGNYQSGNPFSPIMDKVFPCLIRTRATGSTRLHSRSTRSTLSATLDATS